MALIKTLLTRYLKEIMYGSTDGIITTFAVVAGFAGAQANTPGLGLPLAVVLLFGMANLFADAASMGLGNFLSVKTEHDVYANELRKKLKSIQKKPEMEMQRSMQLLEGRGFDSTSSRAIAVHYVKNPSYLARFLLEEEHDMIDPTAETPFHTGLATFLSFVIFGSIPLIPFAVSGGSIPPLWVSSIATGIALVILGILRWRVTRQTVARSLGETILLGSLAALLAYKIGTLFQF